MKGALRFLQNLPELHPPPSPVLQLFLVSVLVLIAAIRSCCGCRTLFYSQERCLLIAIRCASFKDLGHRPALLPGVLKGTAVVNADAPDPYAPLFFCNLGPQK